MVRRNVVFCIVQYEYKVRLLEFVIDIASELTREQRVLLCYELVMAQSGMVI